MASVEQTRTGRLILASSSPRRRELLAEAGVEFICVEPPLPEPADDLLGLHPAQQAEALSYFKAREISDKYPDDFVLAADTIVAAGGQILGKPRDEADARRMLAALSGTRHAVITGVALLAPAGRAWAASAEAASGTVAQSRMIASETTYVTMRKLSAGDIDSYIASNEWQGKAGAYAIQETGDQYIEMVEGSFSNVVGLPVELVKRMLEAMKIRGRSIGQGG
jgi:septum formation protein